MSDDSYTLVKSQKNDVFQALISRGIDPGGFEWHEVTSELGLGFAVSVLFHTPTGYFCRFEIGSQGDLWSIQSPGANCKKQIERTGNWPTQMKVVEQWLDIMKREIEEPDFWETVRSQSSLLEAGAGSATDNSAFSEEERVRIAQDLNEIKEFLFKTLQAGEEHVTRLESIVETIDRAPVISMQPRAVASKRDQIGERSVSVVPHERSAIK